MDKDYRLKLSVSNNRILRAIEEAGYQSVAAFCRVNDLNYGAIISVIGMRTSIVGTNGRLLSAAQSLCDTLCKLPEDLWNENQMYTTLHRSTYQAELTTTQLQAVLENKMDLEKLLDFTGLTSKQRDVIEKRFGLLDGEELTLDEVAELYGVSRTRIRQIECAAMRRIRKKAERMNFNGNTDQH